MATQLFLGAAATVLVRDVERAVRFYTHALGLRLRASHTGPSLDWAEVEAPGVKILLQGSGRPAQPDRADEGAPRVSITFDVEDLDAAMGALGERGVEFATEIAEDAEYRTMAFTDPDGTPLALRQRKR